MRKFQVLSRMLLLLTALAAGTLQSAADDVKKGDVNGDGKITITDAMLIIDHLHGHTSPTFNTTAADVDGGGTITITDAMLIIDIIHYGPNSQSNNGSNTNDGYGNAIPETDEHGWH